MPAKLTVEEGPFQGLTLPLDEGEQWIIGRNEERSDCVIDDASVSPKHARIEKTPEGFVVKNLSRSHPIFVNDDEILKGSRLLNTGDRVKIGPCVFVLSNEDVLEKPTSKGGYGSIFKGLEEGELPPEPSPVEETPEELFPPEENPEEEEEAHHKSAYDTIFEDDGGASDLPFHLLSETPLLLKVISGPNSGAEIGLDKGRSYVVGKDPSTCDIVFQDVTVSRNHARLVVYPEGVLSLEDLGSKNGTTLNGVSLVEKQPLTTADVVAMGTTLFLIIDRDAAQETIFPAQFPAFEKALHKEEVREEAAAEEAVSTPEEVVQEEKSPKIPVTYLVLVGSFAAMILVVFLSFFALFKSENVTLAEKTPHETLKQAFAKFPSVQYTFNAAGGKLFLTGHVLTTIDFQELRYNLSQVAAIRGEEGSVVIDEITSKTINDILNSNAAWKGVSVTAFKPGEFTLHGYVATEEDAGNLIEYVRQNFPYQDLLKNHVVSEEILATQVQGIMLSSGFGAVAPQLTNGVVTLSGRYNHEKEAEYKELVAHLRKLQGVQAVKNFAVPTSPSQATIQLAQKYKVSGTSSRENEGYNAIINGKIYAVGEILDGMKITSVHTNTILLEKDGLNYTIDYNTIR